MIKSGCVQFPPIKPSRKDTAETQKLLLARLKQFEQQCGDEK